MTSCGFCCGVNPRYNPIPIFYRYRLYPNGSLSESGFYHEVKPGNFGYGNAQCHADTGQLELQFEAPKCGS